MNAIRVLLVDDHELARRGLARALSGHPRIDLVDQVDSCTRARTQILMARPDVVVADVQLADGNVISLCRELCARLADPPAFLFWTARRDDDAVLAAIEAGAAGYLLKQTAGDDRVLGAIQSVHAGESVLDPGLVTAAMHQIRRGPKLFLSRYESLTSPERRILHLIGQGLTNRQIGDELYVTEKTIKNNVSIILRKLGFERRTQAAVFASRYVLDERRETAPQPEVASVSALPAAVSVNWTTTDQPNVAEA